MPLFEGKVAIVTGGSSGIGQAACQLYAREGAKVVVSDIDEKRGQETVRAIQEMKGQATFVRTDVSNPGNCRVLKDGVVAMTKLIGGLFGTQENANRAYQALEQSGFTGEEINVFVRKPREGTARKIEVSVQDIALHAIYGALIIGAVGGFLGFLVGIGVLPLPYLEPGAVDRNGLFISMSVLWGLVSGGLTGMILGVAWKLWKSREKAEVMARQIDKRGVLITVSLNGRQKEAGVRRVLEEHEALEVGNPSEKWDLEKWSNSNEKDPSLQKLTNTR